MTCEDSSHESITYILASNVVNCRLRGLAILTMLNDDFSIEKVNVPIALETEQTEQHSLTTRGEIRQFSLMKNGTIIQSTENERSK